MRFPGVLIKEVADTLDADPAGTKPLVEVIRQVRDEVSVMAVKGHGYGDRNLSMVLAKLDEARLWAQEYGVTRGALLVVDKRKYADNLRDTANLDAPAEPTQTTDSEKVTA